MTKYALAQILILLLNLSTLLNVLASCNCPNPPKEKPPPVHKPPKHPPFHGKPPPHFPKPPHSPKPPHAPKPPIVTPPSPTPPVVTPPTPGAQPTCPIDALKLGACVDVLSGLIHIGIGENAKQACCPVLQGLVDLDAAVCLCTTIRLKLLNINVVLPIALQLLIDCGKNPPEGFKCPTS